MSILDPALRNALRTLKLTGMLETLDARLAQTRDGTLGHLDFLQVLCEDEIARRESAALTRRIRAARFPARKSLEEFDFEHARGLKRDLIAHLGTLDFVVAKDNVVFLGPPEAG